jgi:2'-5' RNA ligase
MLPGLIPCEIGPGTSWFGGDRVLQLPASGLQEAADAVLSATEGLIPSTGPSELPFLGHLTLARSRRRRLPGRERAALTGISFRAAFEVRSFDLVSSTSSTEGVRYTTLHTFSLHQ